MTFTITKRKGTQADVMKQHARALKRALDKRQISQAEFSRRWRDLLVDEAEYLLTTV